MVFSGVLAAGVLPSCAHSAPAPTVALAGSAPGQTAPKPDFSRVPGTVINYSPVSSKLFVGSPGIAILPGGNYVAKSDEFGFGIEDKRAITRVFGSSDKGLTWHPLSVINGSFWSTIFVHQGALYLLGTSKQYGNIVIFRSDDGGKTWTDPKDEKTGILRQDGHFHCAPVPVVEYNGRLWRAFEDADGPGGWGSHFRAFMMSVPMGADLLDAKNWTSSNPLERNAAWNGGDFNGWLEGNAVVTPQGHIVDILRVDTRSVEEKVACVQISDDGKTSSFDPQTGFIAFPGGAKKFTIRFDPQSRLYWTLANIVPPHERRDGPGSIRNALALMSSPDLKTWTQRTLLLYHPDLEKHGFQYVDWVFEGNDIIYASRTAYDDGAGGADNYHNANFLTFHRAKNFRQLTLADSVPMPTEVPTPIVRVETRDFTLTGTGFEMGALNEGQKAFSNRTYVWQNVPDAWKSARFTLLGGGQKAKISVAATRDTTIYIATALSQPGVDLKNWKREPQGFAYNDTGKTSVTLYSRALKRGEQLDIPQGNWTGTLVLIPAPNVAQQTSNSGGTPDALQGMNMIEVTAGEFTLGNEAGAWDDKPAHSVTVSHAFRIANRPVSNRQFELFDLAHRSFRGKSGVASGDDDAVRFVTWEQANDYCQWLSQRTGKNYRLPTEAEWDYAFARYATDLQGGREAENWCLDWYGPYPREAQTDPVGYTQGDFRVVRGGSWRAPKVEAQSQPASLARLGALPQDANAVIGLRVVEAPAPTGTPLTERRTPLWARDVSQVRSDWKPVVDAGTPYFAEPLPYVQIAPNSNGPLFSEHNHDPALVACPNGDLLAIWYSTNTEMGRELLVLAARLRHGQKQWDAPDVFWDTPGRNDHAPALWADSAGTLYHFNGIAAEGGWQNLGLLLRTSVDNGRTWLAARFLDLERRYGNMPIPSPFQSADGTLYLPCDQNPSGKGGSLLHVSHDGGKTWSVINRDAPAPKFAAGKTGAWIAGIHTGVDAWSDGTLVAVGRGDDIDGHLALSISHDAGQSWTYAATPFPPISGGMRPVLRRLQEGALLLVSFTPSSQFIGAQNQQFTGQGLFAALSFDGGKTWPTRKLLTDGKTRKFNGQGWTGDFTMDATHAEPKGYLTAIQTPDGLINLISSGVHYRFNVAWLKQPPTIG